MNDVYGTGLLSYLDGNKAAAFKVESNIAETEEWNIEVFFREYKDMPEVEKIALHNVQGTVLDVGAGAGSHALWLQEKGFDVTAIDISEGAVETMKRRGVRQALQHDFFNLKEQKYDTLLMLMNGIGIAGRLKNLPSFFEQAKSLLNKDGKIILDSSDISYLFEEEDGSMWMNFNTEYYGELEYTFGFNKRKGKPFEWLFLDFDTLSSCAEQHGFSCRKLYEDDHYLYLAELKLM